MDKRKDHRFTNQLHVKICSDSGKFWGVLNDVSENGLFIKTNRDLDLDSAIDIEIIMPDNTNANLQGVVTRKVALHETYRKYGLGIKLIKKDIKYMKLLSLSYIGQNRIA